MSSTNVGFDPGVRGTPDSAWRAALASCPAWAPRVGTLVIVSPHPDDETLAAGGLIHSWARLGHRTVVISVTDGEAAYPWPRLGEVRRRELRAALHILGSGQTRSLRLGIPDGQAGSHRDAIKSALLSVIDENSAHGDVTLVCPYEHDGHPDHEAAARACLEAARERELPVARYPVWMWHQAAPTSLERLHCGRFWLDAHAEIAKSQALRCFVSQTQPAHAAPIIPAHVLDYFARPYEVFLV